MKRAILALALSLYGCAAPVFDDSVWSNLVTAEVNANDKAERGCRAVHQSVTLPLERAAVASRAAMPGGSITKAVTILVSVAKESEKARGVFCREQMVQLSNGIDTVLTGYKVSRDAR